MIIKIYRFEWAGLISYVSARSRGKAMMHSVLRLRDAGFLHNDAWPTDAICTICRDVIPGDVTVYEAT